MGTESELPRRVKGLSEAEFRRRFGTEEACRAALFLLRWGQGWACPACGHGRCAKLKGRAVYQCNRCKRQVGLTAGTVFHWTKLPLTTWFLAIYHLSQSKGGMSSVELSRRLGTRQPTAWLVKHKLMAAMAAREALKPKLQGRVEVDDAYLGGQRAGSKRGRGAAGKTPFVATVETTAERKPRRLRLTVVKGFRKKEIATLAKRDLAPGSNVVTDGLSCWTAVEQAGCSHFPMVTGSGPRASRWVPFTPGSTRPWATSRPRLPAPTQARAALPDQLRLALQPTLPAGHPDRASGLCLRAHGAAPVPTHHRRMSEKDNQVKK
jgi:DNA-directed RNA polymerase subunit RPC12/RpoP